jgi:hypothetical protein
MQSSAICCYLEHRRDLIFCQSCVLGQRFRHNSDTRSVCGRTITIVVDIVYDNYGAEGTADKAMHTIREGGVYLLMPHGECYSKRTQGPPCLSANPKAGVRQVNYVTGPDFALHGLQGATYSCSKTTTEL